MIETIRGAICTINAANGPVFPRAEKFPRLSRDRSFFSPLLRPAAQVFPGSSRLLPDEMEAHGLTRKQPIDRIAGEPLWQALVRRMIDVTIAGATVLLLSPLLLAVTIAIRIDSSGPALFRQRRVGHGEREFTLFKFRSMRLDADPRGHREY